MRTAAALLAIVLTSPALAVTPLDQAGSMAAKAGDVIGAAAGCGIDEGRLTQVSIKVVGIIRDTGASPESLKRAQSIFERFAARGTQATKLRPDLCPAAIADFERAERN